MTFEKYTCVEAYSSQRLGIMDKDFSLGGSSAAFDSGRRRGEQQLEVEMVSTTSEGDQKVTLFKC